MAAPWSHLALWASQRQALRLCATYFASQQQKSALIQMPTGAGKTGVIAVIASVRAQHGPVLVLSPSEVLVGQLINELRTRFWQTIGAPHSWPPDAVHKLLPSRSNDIAQVLAAQNGRQVLVGTLQALSQIAEEKELLYRALRQRVSTVLTDEGHREPAPEWAKAVRRLRKPTVLFSATPYRNDQRVFDISDDAVHYLSFREAVEKHYVRDVDFLPLAARRAHRAFADAVVAKVDELVRGHRITPDSKIIVRAADEAGVTALHNSFRAALQGRVDGVLAFHEQYDASTPTRLSSVPDLRTRSERYLIHQFKLNEGVDEPRCGVFVPYDDFSNARNLVQQVGRIIRNPTPLNRPRHRGIVLVPPWSTAPKLWDDYRKYDAICEELKGPVIRTKKLVERYLNVLPAMEYVGRGFRSKVDFSSPGVFDQLVVPRSCVIYKVTPGTSIEQVAAEIRDVIDDEDRLVVSERDDAREASYVAVSIQAADSEFLTNAFFPEFTLQVTMARIVGSFLFVADTAALRLPEEMPYVEECLAPDVLARLFPQASGTRISRITARNSDIGANAIRARAISARSLQDAAPFMGDHLHILSQVRGRTNASAGRYVGMSTGRVRDEHASCTVQQFCDWTDALHAELTSPRSPARYISRFASASGAPPDPSARNILLDVGALEGVFRTQAGSTPDDIEDLCTEVIPTPGAPNKGTFGVTIAGQSAQAQLEYDGKSKRYKVISEALEAFADPNNEKVTLLSRINQKQAFRILCGSRRYIFSSGAFYRIDGPYGLDAVRTAVLDLLTPIAALAPINDEKGSGVGNGVTWNQGSLFRYINDGLITAGSELDGPFDRVVCDDLGDEMADFIAAKGGAQGGKVAYVHAKVGSGNPGVGASPLYDVCSQATKNLVYLRYGAELPNKDTKWGRRWQIGQYRVASRIRAGGGNAAQMRAQIQGLLERPTTIREMWLVLGGMLSRAALDANLNQAEPDYFAIQAAYLLMSADAACKSVGVGLKVFCAP